MSGIAGAEGSGFEPIQWRVGAVEPARNNQASSILAGGGMPGESSIIDVEDKVFLSGQTGNPTEFIANRDIQKLLKFGTGSETGAAGNMVEDFAYGYNQASSPLFGMQSMMMPQQNMTSQMMNPFSMMMPPTMSSGMYGGMYGGMSGGTGGDFGSMTTSIMSPMMSMMNMFSGSSNPLMSFLGGSSGISSQQGSTSQLAGQSQSMSGWNQTPLGQSQLMMSQYSNPLSLFNTQQSPYSNYNNYFTQQNPYAAYNNYNTQRQNPYSLYNNYNTQQNPYSGYNTQQNPYRQMASMPAAPNGQYSGIVQNNPSNITNTTQQTSTIDEADEDFDSGAVPVADAMQVRELHDLGYTGAGQTIVVIDSGIAQHEDFGDRLVAFKDFVNGYDGVENAYDDYGHGTHVAGLAAGSGVSSNGKFEGIAPEADLIGLKVLDEDGNSDESRVLEAIQWTIDNKDEYNITVMNLSIGDYKETDGTDPVSQALEKAAEAGIFVSVAAGNDASKINSFGTSDEVTVVGATDSKGTVTTADDTVAEFSGTGAEDGRYPDVVGVGVNIIGPNNNGGYKRLSGTSMVSPMIAGLAALLRQAAPDADPTEIKEALVSTADELEGFGPEQQGAGEVDALEAFTMLTGIAV